MNEKVGRNDPCHCGSGKKYKSCCFQKEQERKNNPLSGRKFTAKVLSSTTGRSEEPSPPKEGLAKQNADYTFLIERAFSGATQKYVDKPPIPENPSEYLGHVIN